MEEESKAKIFVADERGCDETDWYRSCNTFNFGKYFNEHKQAFNSLNVLNDDTIAGGRCLRMDIEESSVMLLLPVVGAVNYKDSFRNETQYMPVNYIFLTCLPALLLKFQILIQLN